MFAMFAIEDLFILSAPFSVSSDAAPSADSIFSTWMGLEQMSFTYRSISLFTFWA